MKNKSPCLKKPKISQSSIFFNTRQHLLKHLIRILRERIDGTYLNHRTGINLNLLPTIPNQPDTKPSIQRTPNNNSEPKLPIFNSLPKGQSISLIKKHNMRSQIFRTFWALLFYFLFVVRLVVKIFAAHFVGYSVDCVVFVFGVEGFQVEVVDVLGY